MRIHWKEIAISVSLVAGVGSAGAAVAAAQEAADEYTSAAIGYATSHFTGDVEPWHQMSAELLRRESWGSIAGRATLARRFEQTGEQFELESYPILGERAYAYLNVGYSPSGLFPQMRYGAEVFGTVARGLELSAGLRHLDFEVEDVTLYTTSVGYYAGAYYLSLRPFLSSRAGELNGSANLLARRYLADDGSYVGAVIGAGEVPSEETTAFELDRLRSAHAMLDGRHWLSRRLGLRWSAGYEWEELPAERTRGRVTVGIGLEGRL